MSLNSIPSLLSAAQLHGLLDRPELRVLDASTAFTRDDERGSYVASPAVEAYLAEHIPGAVFVDVPHDLSDPDAAWSFTLPSAQRFAEQVGALGIGDTTHVVVYASGVAWATRVWWLLRLFGLETVSVLDGGLPAWKAAGFPTEAGRVEPPRATFTPNMRPELVAAVDEVAELSNSGGCLVNALDAATFRGEQRSNRYPRRGRIPGSRSLPSGSLLDPDTATFRPLSELVDLVGQAGLLDSPRAVTYCGGGISATVAAFAAHLAGNSTVAVYDGSLTEWTADPDRPVELG